MATHMEHSAQLPLGVGPRLLDGWLHVCGAHLQGCAGLRQIKRTASLDS